MKMPQWRPTRALTALFCVFVVLVLIKYYTTGCVVMCMDWHDDVIGYTEHGIPIYEKDLNEKDQ